MSAARPHSHPTLQTDLEVNVLITQSLIIAQQCAIDQLRAVEDEDESDVPLYKRSGGRPDPRSNDIQSEHGRMSRLLHGLSLALAQQRCLYEQKERTFG